MLERVRQKFYVRVSPAVVWRFYTFLVSSYFTLTLQLISDIVLRS